ncbi:hypothetical protein BYT27DRAFT_7197221 [Phlegmacium glaucopus]|nr:hypothetical protein BYT27DRAFT_7197221 [Phlegmacium glaucopus]
MPYLFQSKNTNQFVVSAIQDVDGDVVRTVQDHKSFPELSTFLNVEPGISGPITEATIKGFNLYVAYKGDLDSARPLTWSDKEYKWIIRETAQGTKVITPANGDDIYWVGDLGIAEVVSSSSCLKLSLGRLYGFHLHPSLASLERTLCPPRTSGLWKK